MPASKKATAGRPPLPQEKRRTLRYVLPLNAAERAALDQEATRHGFDSAAQFIRATCTRGVR